jgi:methylamine--corrinoid protein Co-methyltransferase
MVNQGDFTCYFPIHFRFFNNTSKEMLWLVSLSNQALAGNSKLITGTSGMAAAGPCTDMVLYEAGLHGIVCAVSGASVLWEIATASNKHFERTTPVEARMGCETGLAAVNSRLKRSDVNDIVLNLIQKYEDKISNAPLGKTFQECYDVESVKPTREYMELYKRIKKEFEDIGLNYLY